MQRHILLLVALAGLLVGVAQLDEQRRFGGDKDDVFGM
jgi:hypothetical protein